MLTNVTMLTALMKCDCKLYNVDYMTTLEMKSDATLYNIDYSDEK